MADECSEILLEYSGITFSRFGLSGTENSRTLLEQFIFLREFCYSDNLQAWFGSIKRHPDRILVKDQLMKPIGAGNPLRRLLFLPFFARQGMADGERETLAKGNRSNKEV